MICAPAPGNCIEKSALAGELSTGGNRLVAPLTVTFVRFPLTSSRLVILAFSVTTRVELTVPLPPAHVNVIFPICSASPSA